MNLPPSLYPGARMALLAPSSAVSAQKLETAVELVRSLGLEPVVYPSCREGNRRGGFAADDGQRAKDLQDAFSAPSIQGIWCVRGGYGAGRLLPLLNWREIARHPKVFCGYSDVTALHIALNKCCGMVTYHTPMPATSLVPEDGFTLACLRRALFGALSGPMPLGDKTVTLSPGRARGVLCGGNLSLVRDSLGTPWELDTRGKLLFLEEVGERPCRVDVMLTQLRNAGKLDGCAGFLLGGWTDCVPDRDEASLTLEEIFRELLLPTGKPILANLPAGHLLPSMSLPLGAMAVLDADQKTLEVCI